MMHSIITRMNFGDSDLMEQYLSVTKKILIPSLKSQKSKKFEWVIITNEDNLKVLEKELDYPFVPMFGNNSCHSYLIDGGKNIQTRHDCDDWMSPDYVETIQNFYTLSIGRYSKFLIQAQPTKLDYNTGKELKISRYHDKRCSMFLSLCQENVENHIFERKHGQMYEVVPDVFTIPEENEKGGGYVKWVIHGKNRSVIEKK
jgi:hypothetical protein